MRLINGESLAELRKFDDGHFHAVVTDPPYELGFMGKAWDGQGIAYSVEFWREVLRVLKPGGHLLAFGATRTYHRMTCAIEDAGFEIRDSLHWMYATGFPKSLDVSKAIDDAAGAEREVTRAARVADTYRPEHVDMDPRASKDRERRDKPATDAAKQWGGWGTALKPAHEPIVLARKPLIGTVAGNVTAHGTGALNIDACRIETQARPLLVADGVRTRNGAGGFQNGSRAAGETTLGRWPANVLLDEDAAAELDAQTGDLGKSRGGRVGKKAQGIVTNVPAGDFYAGDPGFGDSGGASRFFYVAKPGRKERDAGGVRNVHPTVKPVELMRYLVRLVTPPGGLVLDPFLGSGTTGVAAHLEGFDFVGIEREAEYMAIAEARIAACADLFST